MDSPIGNPLHWDGLYRRYAIIGGLLRETYNTNSRIVTKNFSIAPIPDSKNQNKKRAVDSIPPPFFLKH
jgi:hypothetical protein